MNEYIKIAEYDDSKYSLLSQFLTTDDRILFAYTRFFNNKYTYEFVDDIINQELIEKYLKNVERNEI